MKRTFLISILILVSLPFMAFAKEKELVVCAWGGAFEKAQKEAYYDPFEKETGIKVTAVAPPNVAKVKAMVKTKNVEWDIVVVAGGMMGPLLREGLLEKVDYKYFDKKTLDELFPGAKGEFFVGTFYFSVVLAYHTGVYSKANHPRSWKEFWDVKKFPGPRTLMSPAIGGAGWEFALVADGVPKDKVYENVDLDRAFRKFSEIKPHVAKWWRQGQEAGQLLVDKEVVLGNAYNGRIQQLAEEGAPVDIDWNEGKLYLEYLLIPKGAPNYDNAMKFLAFQSRADRQAHLSKLFPYGPVNQVAVKMLPPERAQMMPSYPENKNKQFVVDESWFLDNMEKVIEKWSKWQLQK